MKFRLNNFCLDDIDLCPFCGRTKVAGETKDF